MLADREWDGPIVAEINTRKAKSEAERLDMPRETLAFAREHTSIEAAAPTHESPLRRAIDAILPAATTETAGREPRQAVTGARRPAGRMARRRSTTIAVPAAPSSPNSAVTLAAAQTAPPPAPDTMCCIPARPR